MQISIGNLGAVIGTQLYRTNDSPRYILGHSFALGYLVANIVVTSTLWAVLSRINRQRDTVEGQHYKATSEDFSSADFKGDADVRWRFRY